MLMAYITSLGDGCRKHPPQPLRGSMLIFSAEADSNQTRKAVVCAYAPSAKNLLCMRVVQLEAHPKAAAWG